MKAAVSLKSSLGVEYLKLGELLDYSLSMLLMLAATRNETS